MIKRLVQPMRRYPLSEDERTKLNASALDTTPYEIVRKEPHDYEYSANAFPVDAHVIAYYEHNWPVIQQLVRCWRGLPWGDTRIISTSTSGLRPAAVSQVIQIGDQLLIAGECLFVVQPEYKDYCINDPELATRR